MEVAQRPDDVRRLQLATRKQVNSMFNHKLTCEVCATPVPAHGVTCDACHAARLDGLLRSKAWRDVAATRSGDLPGESMLDTVVRERGALKR